MAEEIREVLSLLNDKLSGLFPYRLELTAPGDLKLLEKNARYMKTEQFKALVENIKQDGNLSSLPLCYREKDGRLRVLSGNHRIMAARKAGIKQVLVMVVADEKDEDQRLAIQLSHNAIVGKDDLVILKELWESIKDMNARIYAGLDSDILKSLQTIDFLALSERPAKTKIVNLLFLPEDLDDLDALLKETAEAFAGDAVYLAHLHTFDAFFELIVRVKKRCKIKNSAAAFLKLMDLARIGLEQMLEQEAMHGGETAPQEHDYGLG